jgi:ligand-binding sensor protein/GAF domain-containing protein
VDLNLIRGNSYGEENRMARANSKLELSSIVDLSHLEAVHDVFSEETGLATAILDEEARPITLERYHCPFCTEVRSTKAGVLLCRESDQHGIDLAKKEKGPVVYHCKQGLVEFCAPITVDGETIAFFFGGQLRCADGKFRTPDRPLLGDLSKMAVETGDNPNIVEMERKFQDVKLRELKDFEWARRSLTRLSVQLNSVVNKIHNWKRVKVVDDFMGDAVGAQTVDELFNLIVETLPSMMRARHCSILTVQGGEPEEFDRLVLQKTSKKEERSTYFNRGEGLTGWIWENPRPLRLRNVKNPAELVSYGYPDQYPKWEHKDCDEHESFLGVPMRGRSDEVIGVIAVFDKEPSGFDGHDTILLSFLARHLSWAIEYQTAKDKFQFVKGLLKAASELTSTKSREELFECIVRHSKSLFGGGKGKKYFVNTHKPGSREWKIERIGGDLVLTEKEWSGKVYPTSEGLTGRAIREKRPILLYNLKEAKEKGHYVEAVRGAECAMVAPMQYEGEIHGVIGVVSNDFSFSREKDLEILNIFAELCAVAVARIPQTQTARRKGHILIRFGRWIWNSIFVPIMPEIVRKWLGL